MLPLLLVIFCTVCQLIRVQVIDGTVRLDLGDGHIVQPHILMRHDAIAGGFSDQMALHIVVELRHRAGGGFEQALAEGVVEVAARGSAGDDGVLAHAQHIGYLR